MKYLLLLVAAAGLLLFISCKARPGTSPDLVKFDTGVMDSMWQKVDSLERKGLYASALEEIIRIKQAALTARESGHLVKAIMYENRYLIQLEEDSAIKALQRGEQEISTYPEPAKSVMHAMMAEWYADYLRSHLWDLRNRTAYEGPAGTDIRTWGIRHFLDRIALHFNASIQWEGLPTAKVEDFQLLLTEDQKTDFLRPTLYDILMHKALDYFAGAESYVTQTQDAFVLRDPIAFARAEVFASRVFEPSDSISPVWRTLRGFQSLLSFRLKDEANQAALVDADLKRLLYVMQHYSAEDKDSLYLAALQSLKTNHTANPESSLIDYHLAEWYMAKGAGWNHDLSHPDRYAYKKALEICQEANQNFPDAYGSKLCLALIDRIRQSSLSGNVESVNLPREELLARLEYKNLKEVYCTLVKLPSSPKRWIDGRWDGTDMLKRLYQLPVDKTWKQALDDGGDFQPHSTEIGLPALPTGHYALLISDQEKPSAETSNAGSIMFTVSALGYWFLDDKVQAENVAIINRATGKPEPDVKVEFITQEYNPGLRRQEEVILGEGKSGTDGWVKVPAHDNKSISLRLTKGEDELYMDEAYYSYRPNRSSASQPTTLFFTDRAIYRPGQKVYFKGFAIQFDQDRMPSSVPKKNIDVVLYDANGQEVSKQSVRSNDYGTFAGHFDLPYGGLTGKMSISSNHGGSRYYFNVEEYKRPKFEITFDSIKESYRLGQEVVVRSVARDYAGSAVTGAMANYRVERVTYTPWWWYSRMYWPVADDRQVLATGKAITGAGGGVTIPFVASGKPGNPAGMMYRFEITVSVTDITGESHELTKSLVLNEQGFEVQVNLTESVNTGDLKSIKVNATNSDGANVNVQGRISVSRLVGPQRHLRERLWSVPDLPGIAAEDYVARFPHYAVPGKENMNAWPVEKTMGTQTFDISGTGVIDLSGLRMTPGYYKLNWVWKNSEGRELPFEQFVMVYAVGQALPSPIALQVDMEERQYAPSDTVKVHLMSGLLSTPEVIRLVEHRTGPTEQYWLARQPGKDQDVIIGAQDRGGLYVYHLTTFNNRFYRNQQLVSVPWTNKQLEVSLKTWRDQLEPGAEETWSLIVTGKEREKQEAELLLSMYDASLDAFVPHQWSMNLFPMVTGKVGIQSASAVAASYWGLSYKQSAQYVNIPIRQYRTINAYGYYPEGGYGYGGRTYRGRKYKDDGILMMQAEEAMPAPSAMPEQDAVLADEKKGEPGGDVKADQKEQPNPAPVLRTALDETVFFYPQLHTDANGHLTFSFKMKEGLTRWKFQALAFGRDLAFGITSEELVTRKKVMVFPNPPRFFRTSDTIAFQAKVTNLIEEGLQGKANLKILDAISGEDVSSKWGIGLTEIPFQVGAGSSTPVQWMLHVPGDWHRPVKYQIAAQTDAASDGEEALLPVVTNRVLVTETLPLPLKANETRTFIFKSMEERTASMQDHRYTVEMTTSPAWYAVQALPYLMEYPHECAEQVFSRLYGNALAAHIANTYPAIRSVYDTWRLTESDALLSNLEKNKDLKNILLEETPWVRDAMGETQQKKDIALLFESNRINQEAKQAIEKLIQMQMSNGGFPWFPGGKDNWYITQYIVEGFGHLNKMGVTIPGQGTDEMLARSLPYIDARMVEWYEDLKAQAAKGKLKMEDHHVGAMQVHYLYARSFFPEVEHVAKVDEVNTYLLGQLRKYWLQHGLFEQGLMAAGLHRRLPNDTLPAEILASLRERTILHDELGRYWKIHPGIQWTDAGVELQALMIELFQDMKVPQAEVDELRVWLLKQKQTHQWSSTKSTASAIYALLIHPDAWLTSVDVVKVQLGQKEVIGKATAAEAGTSYVKRSWEGKEIEKSWKEITVSNPNPHIAWGSAYWQYWEDLDQVKFPVTEKPFNVKRTLLLASNTDRGETTTIADAQHLKVGDKLVVRLEIETDRAMDFVHLKDVRASGFEPQDVLSGYQWGGGLGYYQSTKDLATHFFIDHLPRGKFVIEYAVKVAQEGHYSDGLAQLQCMYAPEFAGHSYGQRVVVSGLGK